MIDRSTLALFALTAAALLVLPGPNVLYIVTRSMNQGRQAGITSSLAVALGDLGHGLAATLGLSTLVLSSPLLFAIVKYVGVCYLLYLGGRTLLTPATSQLLQSVDKKPLRQIFGQGLMVSLLNPKTALFFLAFLPQFVRANAGSIPSQFLTLSGFYVLLSICITAAYALLAGWIGDWLKRSQSISRLQPYIAGVVYIGLGISAAFARGE